MAWRPRLLSQRRVVYAWVKWSEFYLCRFSPHWKKERPGGYFHFRSIVVPDRCILQLRVFLASVLDTLSIFSPIVRSVFDFLPSSLLWWNVNSRCVNNCGTGWLGKGMEFHVGGTSRELLDCYPILQSRESKWRSGMLRCFLFCLWL